MKSRLKGAQKGHSLLKKKADALQMRFRLILKKIIDVSFGHTAEVARIHHLILPTDQNTHGRCDERGSFLPCRS